jgi:DnaJ-class molecular chaperone
VARSDGQVLGLSPNADAETIQRAYNARWRALQPILFADADTVVGRVDVDPSEARHGTTKEVALDEPRACEACGGKGGEVKPCVGCGGLGRRRTVVDTRAWRLLRLEACEVCGGGGVLPDRECPNCGGRGVEDEVATEVVRVPPGVQDFDRVRVGPEQVAVVKIVPRRRFLLRLLAFAGGMLALAFLLFLLSL